MTVHPAADRDGQLDQVGRALIAGGGCLTLVVYPLVTLGFLVFGAVLAIGLAEDTARVAGEAEGLIAGALVVLGVLALLFMGLWLLALRGRTWAQALSGAIGVALAFLAFPFPRRLGPDYQRPEDVQFTLVQLLVSLAPAALATGSLLRIVAKRRLAARRSSPPAGR